MANYITDAELKAQLSINDTVDDTQVALAATAATRRVNALTGREFEPDTSATSRVYEPLNIYRVLIDDAHEITSVKTGPGDGTYTTTLTVTTDYWTKPLDGIGADLMAGWPASSIETEGILLKHRACRPTVQVTAKWGWAAVPEAVKQATMFLGVRYLRLRDVPFGLMAGGLDTGPMAVRDLRDVMQLLNPYVKTSTTIGVA